MDKQINHQETATGRKYLWNSLNHEANKYEPMWTTYARHKQGEKILKA